MAADGPRVRIGEDEGRRALLIEGVVQSVALDQSPVAGYWPALLPRLTPRRALVLGLGGGTVVQLLWRRFGPVPVVAVEADPEVVAFGRAEFGLDRPELVIHVADAFAFLADYAERFDYVCVDLFRGGRLERGVLGRPFLRQLKRVTNPGGEVAINLVIDRRIADAIHRIGRVLTVRYVERIEKNLIVKAGVR